MDLPNNRKSQSSSSQSGKDDSILLILIAFSMAIGILLPSFGIIEPFLLIWLGFLLFLNLIKMDPQQLALIIKNPLLVIIFTIIKFIAIPIILYAVTNRVYPPLALPVLLLSGISTGLGAPFVINIFEKSNNRMPFVVGMTILTSIAVPFILPSLVFLLVDVSKFEIPIANMMILLGEALFVPLFAGWFTKRKAPKLAKKIEEKSFILSLILISFINFGIFAKYSNYFFLSTHL